MSGTTLGPGETFRAARLRPPPPRAEWHSPPEVKAWGWRWRVPRRPRQRRRRNDGSPSGRSAGKSRGRPRAPEGPGPSGGAQGGSIHSGCITAVHNVPLSVLIRPLPSVLDQAKVQSLVDTIRVRPREAGCWKASEEGGRAGREKGLVQFQSEFSLCSVTLSKFGPLWASISSWSKETGEGP